MNKDGYTDGDTVRSNVVRIYKGIDTIDYFASISASLSNSRAELARKLDKPTSGKYVLDTDLPSQFEELVKVGGRNLILGTTSEQKSLSWTDWYNYTDFKSIRGLTAGTYTLSFQLHSYEVQDREEGKLGVHMYVRLISKDNREVRSLVNPFVDYSVLEGKYVCTFTIDDTDFDSLYFRFRDKFWKGRKTISYSSIKLERGNVATDWTPAPEDLLAELDKYIPLKQYNTNREEDKRELDATMPDRIKEKIKGDTELQELLKGRDGKDGAPGRDGTDGADGAPGKDGTDGKDGHTPKLELGSDGYLYIDKVKQSTLLKGARGEQGPRGATGAKGAKGDKGDQGAKGDKGDAGKDGENPNPSDVADLIANSKTYRDKITYGLPDEARVKELARELDEERKVGGRNLIKDSKNTLSNSDYYVGRYYIADPSQMVTGEEYTIQVWGTIDGGDYSETLWVYNSGGNTKVASIQQITNGVWKQTFKWRDDANKSNSYLNLYRAANHPDNNKSFNTTITKIKLERGNVATDWTPAPEDLLGALDSVKRELNQTITDGLSKKADTSALDSAKRELNQTITDGLKKAVSTLDFDGFVGYVGEKFENVGIDVQSLRDKDKSLEAKQMQDDEREWLKGVMRKLIPSDIDPDAFANGKFVSMSSDLSLRSSNGSPTALLGGSTNKKQALLLAGIKEYGTDNQTEQTAIYEDGSAKFGEVSIANDRIELKSKKGEPLALTADDAVFVEDVVARGKINEDSLSISTKAITNSSSGVKLGDFSVANDGTKVTISIGKLTSEVYAVGKSMLLMLDVDILGSWSGKTELVDTGGGAFGKPNFSIDKTPLVAQNLTWERYLNKGSHTLLAIIYSNVNTDKGRIEGLNVHQSYDASKMQTLISQSGVRAYGGSARYFDVDARMYVPLAGGNVIPNYYTARVKGGMRVDSLTLEQPLDAPGCVLAGGEVDSSGSVVKSFGKYKKRRGGDSPYTTFDYDTKLYTIYHSIGNTNYIPVVTSRSSAWADVPRVMSIDSNSFTIKFINQENTDSNWRQMFIYVCYKAD